MSGQPELKRTAVVIEPFRAGWYGFGVCQSEPDPDCAYWAKAATGAGWRVELAEKGAPLDFESFARGMLGIDAGEAVSYTDAASGQSRIAFFRDGRVEANRLPSRAAFWFRLWGRPTAPISWPASAAAPDPTQGQPSARASMSA